MHAGGEEIAMLTCYDAAFAHVLGAAGVDSVLIGDSLGMVLQGQSSTVPVMLDEMAYHTRCVAHGNCNARLLGDLPFGSYHESPARAFAGASALMRADAHMLKFECCAWTVPAALAREITVASAVAVIGIGATSPQEAMQRYAAGVEAGMFPDEAPRLSRTAAGSPTTWCCAVSANWACRPIAKRW